MVWGSITSKHVASGVRKLMPALSCAGAWRRLRGEQLVKLADVPGLSRMSNAFLAEIFTWLQYQHQVFKSPVQEKGKHFSRV